MIHVTIFQNKYERMYRSFRRRDMLNMQIQDRILYVPLLRIDYQHHKCN